VAGAGRTSFKQQRKHPYGGIRTGKPRSSKLMSVLRNRDSLSSIQNILNEHQQGKNTELSDQLKLRAEMSVNTLSENDEMYTTTDSQMQSESFYPALHEPELLQNIFNNADLK
jgi:hypothetical protein